MAEAAEMVRVQTEHESRRTDDPSYNIRYLAEHLVNKEQSIFEEHAEADVLEQNLTEIAEADVHGLGPIVYQHKDEESGQYISLGGGTVDNAIKGVTALDVGDGAAIFELYRRVEEVTEETTILDADFQEGMRRGGKKFFISPSPTHHETDLEAALSFDYDDRTMLRIQTLSQDGKTKAMMSFSVFGVPAKAWAAYLSSTYQGSVEPTAIDVMQFCNALDLEFKPIDTLLTELLTGVAEFLPEAEQKVVQGQLHTFLHKQEELEKQALYYAREKLTFQKELACSLNDWARPSIARLIKSIQPQLNENDKAELAKRYGSGGIFVDDYVMDLAVKIKTVTTDNRAGLATLNERTVRRVASRIGLEAALQMGARELALQNDPIINEFMVLRNEQLIAKSGVGCGGGCSVSVVDLFSAEGNLAKEAGLKGTLYASSELDAMSGCGCPKGKAKILSDGKNVVCFNCRKAKVNGKVTDHSKAKAA